MRNRVQRLMVLCVGALVLSPLHGCIERRIRVTSTPAGARVWLNDEPIGLTPCEAGFTYYGTYDVRLELDGYEPVNEGRTAHAPLHEYPGPDLVATLLPVQFENTVEWHFDLTETQTGEEADAALKERADELRSRATDPPE